MPGDVLYCKNCNAFNDWRRWIPGNAVVLALIATILSLLTAILPPIARRWNKHSDTHVRLLGVDRIVIGDTPSDVLLAAVANNGARPSTVRSAAIEYAKDGHLVHVTLNIVNAAQKLVQPGKTEVLHLTPHSHATKAEKYKGKDQHVTLKIAVEETTRFGNPDLKPRDDEVHISLIKEWMADWTQ